MSEPLRIGGATLYLGDCLEVLRTLPEASVDACVCDPPYDLLQASRRGSGRSNEPNNPYGRHGSHGGGFMGLAWDATGIAFKPETWAEVLRVLKPGAYLLAFGGTRTYHRMACAIEDAGVEIRDSLHWMYGTGFPKNKREDGDRGSALKPGHEPCVLARKQCIGSVAANLAAHGTGALNIGGCRIGTGKRVPSSLSTRSKHATFKKTNYNPDAPGVNPRVGRFPANVVFSHLPDCTDAACAPGCAVAELDAQSGVLTSGKADVLRRNTDKFRKVYSEFKGEDVEGATYGDTGGASRFFYCAKPSPDERDGNTHPTVKPVALMRWLCRLVTPPGGLVLDPFMGSGTTGVACASEGLRFVGIEREPAYFAIAERRLRAATAQGQLFASRAAP